MKNNELAEAWLKRAISSLEKAKIGKISDALFYEDLCFDCQQAAEKALKAFLIYKDITFPKTHSLNMLIALGKGQNIQVPVEIESAVILNDYAVETRYPGEYEAVTEAEYLQAVDIAKKVVHWVSEELQE
ncbi:MAG TPA: HEPN domain-containing protein [Bacillota bacterium]|nr:HEPN domain-containing protein [Bacillota bacterium]